SVAVAQHARAARLQPLDRLTRRAALGGFVVGDAVEVGNAGLQLHDRPGGAVALLAAARTVGDAEVVLALGRDHAVGAVAKADLTGQRVDGVVAVSCAGLVEVRHGVPAHPDL